MSPALPPPDAAALWQGHENLIAGMTEAQLLVMAREMLASRMRLEFQNKRGMIMTRQESLEAVFAAEAETRANGALPKVDFFLPLDNDFPELVL